MKVKIRKGDKVEVISGRLEDQGKVGEVIKVLPKEGRVVVQGVNLRKKHQRQVQTQGRRSMSPGIIEFEGSIHISNVMLVCPKCNQAARVGIQREVGEVVRICKNCQALIDK
ncbi:MAG TPA: 50S ribosomal protein L24 [Anaerolineales bacterium]|nr:50S ribosomal protein L24 [Anaerolineales bacterium]